VLRLGGSRGKSAAARILGSRALRLGQTWEIAAWKLHIWEVATLEKYPWKVATWENAFGKLRIIKWYYLKSELGSCIILHLTN